MRYLVEVRCYWNGKLYDRGEVVVLPLGLEPPEHFKAAETVPETETSSQKAAAPTPGRRRKKE